jgi:hypothetical protein
MLQPIVTVLLVMEQKKINNDLAIPVQDLEQMYQWLKKWHLETK